MWLAALIGEVFRECREAPKLLLGSASAGPPAAMANAPTLLANGQADCPFQLRRMRTPDPKLTSNNRRVPIARHPGIVRAEHHFGS